MNENQPPPPAAPKTIKGLLCPKCDHLNPPGLTACEYCDTALFVKCPNCGQQVQAVLYRCANCGQRVQKKRLRKPRWWQLIFRGGRKLTPWQIVLLVIAVWVTYLVVLNMSK